MEVPQKKNDEVIKIGQEGFDIVGTLTAVFQDIQDRGIGTYFPDRWYHLAVSKVAWNAIGRSASQGNVTSKWELLGSVNKDKLFRSPHCALFSFAER